VSSELAFFYDTNENDQLSFIVNAGAPCISYYITDGSLFAMANDCDSSY